MIENDVLPVPPIGYFRTQEFQATSTTDCTVIFSRLWNTWRRVSITSRNLFGGGTFVVLCHWVNCICWRNNFCNAVSHWRGWVDFHVKFWVTAWVKSIRGDIRGNSERMVIITTTSTFRNLPHLSRFGFATSAFKILGNIALSNSCTTKMQPDKAGFTLNHWTSGEGFSAPASHHPPRIFICSAQNIICKTSIAELSTSPKQQLVILPDSSAPFRLDIWLLESEVPLTLADSPMLFNGLSIFLSSCNHTRDS